MKECSLYGVMLEEIRQNLKMLREALVGAGGCGCESLVRQIRRDVGLIRKAYPTFSADAIEPAMTEERFNETLFCTKKTEGIIISINHQRQSLCVFSGYRTKKWYSILYE